MIRFRMLLVMLFLGIYMGVSQTASGVSPNESVSKYFKIPRESIFVHLNKSIYLPQEEIWFKAYVFDRKNGLPSLATTNFNVELFDVSGNEVYSGLFLGSEGNAKGNIKINPSWGAGEYYIRVSTNWMNNFIEEDSFVAKLKILDTGLVPQKTDQQLSYDLQVLPEGGHLVSEIESTLAAKLIDNKGLGIMFYKGVVLDDTGTEITTFTSNKFGLAKFTMVPKTGMTYTAKVFLDEEQEVEASLPKTQSKGMVMQVDNQSNEVLKIKLSIHSSTRLTLQNQLYYLLVHQNQKSKIVPVSFPEDKLESEIVIDRSELYAGVNTLTVFNKNTPVLERLVFNTTNQKIKDVRVSKLNAQKDSLIMSINVPSNKDITYDMSVSVLPEKTKGYAHHNSMVSAMLLQPYVKGFVEDAGYYFEDNGEERQADLDVLLLTQGWSRYSWNNIFNYEPKVLYDFNRGLVLRGRVHSTRGASVEKVYLFPSDGNKGKVIDIDRSNNSFVINTLFLKKDDRLRFSTIRSNGSMSRANMNVKVQTNRFKRTFDKELPDMLDRSRLKQLLPVKVPENFYVDDIEELDEVVIKGDKLEELEEAFIPERFKDKTKKITLEDTRMYPNILDYIATQGYRIKYGYFQNLPKTVMIVPINPTSSFLPPEVYIDDLRIDNLELLFNLRSEEISQILVDKTGSVAGQKGSGSIFIYTRKVPLQGYKDTKQHPFITEHIIDKGFEPVKEVYTPAYIDYYNTFFEDYGAIHWLPNIKIDSKTDAITFKIPNTPFESLKFFVEGMGSDGSLISKEVIVKNIDSN
ncbi:hypothetical protein M0D21_22860 [Aquimarina sp. D1M17]|uniref:hypothetical protein n=1 Tax=Aquimarina acroporae TaxID=2937283 RepID=UPI0020BF232F|nr:hypothetical protein [Aquimarina acroporae]MCK8524432.1 hypothetical protein [Aquimarina acroporae]